jgi:hypothetical protein
MHAVGPAAEPPLSLAGPTVECIERAWRLRTEGVTAYVTIDAGGEGAVRRRGRCSARGAGGVARRARARVRARPGAMVLP